MATSISLSLLFSLLFLSTSHSKPIRLRPQTLQKTTQPHKNDNPTRFFEVTKPIKTTTKPCSHLALSHEFANTYQKPPVASEYRFPSRCVRGESSEFSKVVLEWTATCRGRQFDRIFGVWLGGVELLRSCTAEPTKAGIVWTVEKDITRYHSLLVDKHKNQTLSVYLGNVIDTTFTGIYHVNLTFHFYPISHKKTLKTSHSWPDLILPISRNLPLNDGLWFEIQNSTSSVSKKINNIPKNTYKAVLEVYVSFHENDEFWYGNLPNEYIDANDVTGFAGNGPFREVLARLDGDLVGAIWPFTVIFTGGINPLLWRPISAIGSFDLPSYDIEITPFLGKLLDGKSHEFAFDVTFASNVWYVDANLHLWLDPRSKRTQAKLVELVNKPLSVSSVTNFAGLEGTFVTKASRSLTSVGWVKSSLGLVTTHFSQDLYFDNEMKMKNDGNTQIVDQKMWLNNSVYAHDVNSLNVDALVSNKSYSFGMFFDIIDHGNGTHDEISNVTLGLKEKKIEGSSLLGFLRSDLKNWQSGKGHINVGQHLVYSGLASTEQVYEYVGHEMCYFRNISSSNYTILYDHVETKCGKRKHEDYLDGLWG